MNSTETSKDVIRNYVDALRTQDGGPLERFFAADATWTLIGDLPISGTWRGHQGILGDFLGTAFVRLAPETLDLAVLDLIGEGEKVVLEWTSKARLRDGDGWYDQHCLAVFTVRDALITSVREYFDTEHARQTLFNDRTPAAARN
ncbi:nuclear transport factor 2 family protein [Streptacidiphilus cavernicola]|uniref:Nuclear transport factor 2 family protein n=1 Tax=Streptacidiphilus cavernicola TaxID=3342716 RepID=A0ABV6VVJ0_9ACTN